MKITTLSRRHNRKYIAYNICDGSYDMTMIVIIAILFLTLNIYAMTIVTSIITPKRKITMTKIMMIMKTEFYYDDKVYICNM